MSKAIDLKTIYAKNTLQPNKNSDVLNKRLFDTYNKIAIKITGSALKGVNIDLGSGDKGFSAHCSTIGIISYPYDLPDFDLEKDALDHNSESVDFIMLNAVIEHLKDPSNVLKELKVASIIKGETKSIICVGQKE